MIGDKYLLAQLAGSNMVAINAAYHRACLTKFYRNAETVGCDMTESNATQIIRAHALNELVDFIEDYRGSRESLAMGDLTALYEKHIVGLVFSHIKCNTTRLRENIEHLIPDIKPVRNKLGWSIIFEDGLSKALPDMKDNTCTDVSIILKAAKILR